MKLRCYGVFPFTVLVLLILFPSCMFFSPQQPPEVPSGFSEEAADSGSAERITYETNDSSLYGSFNWYLLQQSEQSPFSSFSASVSKTSGYAYGDYGIVFCATDEGDFYYVSLDTHGSFSVGKRTGGDLVPIRDWSTSPALVSGYAKENTIRVTSPSAGAYQVFFNDTLACSFSDTAHGSGKSGFLVYIGSEQNERFPDTKVRVEFSVK